MIPSKIPSIFFSGQLDSKSKIGERRHHCIGLTRTVLGDVNLPHLSGYPTKINKGFNPYRLTLLFL